LDVNFVQIDFLLSNRSSEFTVLPIWLENMRTILAVLWYLTHSTGSHINETPQKAHLCAELRHMTKDSQKRSTGS